VKIGGSRRIDLKAFEAGIEKQFAGREVRKKA